MIIQIDTTKKTIKVDSTDTIGSILNFLDNLFPGKDYLDYKFEVEKEIVKDPVFIPYRDTTPIPCSPYGFPWENGLIIPWKNGKIITCCDKSTG